MDNPNDFKFYVGPAARALGVKLHFSSDESKVTNWGDNVNPPTDEELNAKIVELVEEYDANQYQRDRKRTYPSKGDQLDMQYHDQLDGTTTWKDAIAKIKADNPKE